jgi:hypothetical protein
MAQPAASCSGVSGDPRLNVWTKRAFPCQGWCDAIVQNRELQSAILKAFARRPDPRHAIGYRSGAPTSERWISTGVGKICAGEVARGRQRHSDTRASHARLG